MSLSDTLYSADQVKNIEKYAINECAISGFALMQAAGQATFDQMRKYYPESRSLCVICSTGNNGGDGFIVARLALEANLKVTLIQLGNEDSINGDALLAKEKWHKSGGVSLHYDSSTFSKHVDADLIVDAIFGTGLNRDLSGDYLEVIKSINTKTDNFSNAKVIAIDIPSGLSANTGAIFGDCIRADLTVTFVGLKQGLFTGKARDYTGKIVFDDLSVPAVAYEQLEITHPIRLIPNNIIEKHLKPRPKCAHKGNFGHVLFIGGDEGMQGAIRLAAEAALRCGSGLVSVATHPTHSTNLNLGRPEIMVHGIAQASALKPLIEKATVIVIGPGLGLSEWSKSLFVETISSNLPTVLDADALNLLADENNAIKPKENWILTPHPKEMSRLLGISTAEVENDRFKYNLACIEAKTESRGTAETTKERNDADPQGEVKPNQSGGVSILKGAGTLISNKHNTFVCNQGNPGMASGGMGDVLSGVIAAMLAQGLSLFNAASAGVYLHATAADLAAENGERGLLASDLFSHLRTLVNPEND